MARWHWGLETKTNKKRGGETDERPLSLASLSLVAILEWLPRDLTAGEGRPKTYTRNLMRPKSRVPTAYFLHLRRYPLAGRRSAIVLSSGTRTCRRSSLWDRIWYLPRVVALDSVLIVGGGVSSFVDLIYSETCQGFASVLPCNHNKRDRLALGQNRSGAFFGRLTEV